MDVYVCRYSVLQNIGYLLFSQKNIFSQRFCCRKGDYSKCWQLMSLPQTATITPWPLKNEAKKRRKPRVSA